MTLRIQRSTERELVVFSLTGRIQIEQVYELLALLRSQSSPHSVVLDLQQVRLVDRDAVLFLALSEARGVRLRNCPAYIREWINQERNTSRNGSEDAAESADQGE
jgi:anti-anti-sigma regulatory factor